VLTSVDDNKKKQQPTLNSTRVKSGLYVQNYLIYQKGLDFQIISDFRDWLKYISESRGSSLHMRIVISTACLKKNVFFELKLKVESFALLHFKYNSSK